MKLQKVMCNTLWLVHKELNQLNLLNYCAISPGILVSHFFTLPGTEFGPFSLTVQQASTISARVILLPRIHCCFASFASRLFKAAVLSLLPASDWSIQLSTYADSSGVKLPYKSGSRMRQKKRAIVISPVKGVWTDGDTTRNGRSPTEKNETKITIILTCYITCIITKHCLVV